MGFSAKWLQLGLFTQRRHWHGGGSHTSAAGLFIYSSICQHDLSRQCHHDVEGGEIVGSGILDRRSTLTERSWKDFQSHVQCFVCFQVDQRTWSIQSRGIFGLNMRGQRVAGKVRSCSKFSACAAENAQIKGVWLSSLLRSIFVPVNQLVLWLTNSSFKGFIHPVLNLQELFILKPFTNQSLEKTHKSFLLNVSAKPFLGGNWGEKNKAAKMCF